MERGSRGGLQEIHGSWYVVQFNDVQRIVDMIGSKRVLGANGATEGSGLTCSNGLQCIKGME